jgi:hypothetical protein
MTRSLLVAVLAAAAGSTAWVPTAAAQVVTGRVLEAGSSRPLHEVAVTLTSQEGRVLARAATDTSGGFWLRAPRFGEFRLNAELIGMTAVTTHPIDVSDGATHVLLRMAVAAVPLEPLTVEARGGDADLGMLRGYYERMFWYGRSGTGRFITRDAIDARDPGNISDMLREFPRLSVSHARGTGAFITVRGAGGQCHPALFVDGLRVNRRDRAYIDEMVRPGEVEGVEVYVGLAQLPGIYHDESGCGVLLVWTRRAPDGGSPMSWGRALAGVGILTLILLLMR